MKNRVCVLSTPRSGSTYMAEVISGTLSHFSCNQYEPFTWNQLRIPAISKNNILISEVISDSIPTKERVNRVLTTFKKCDISQPIVIKLFFFPDLDDYLDEIFSELKKLNFRLIILKRRNVEEQLVSAGIASASNFWHNSHGNLTASIDVKNFDLIKGLYSMIEDFDNKILKHKLKNVSVVYYETMIEDLNKIFNKSLNYSHVRSSVQRNESDIYKFVSNKEEVKMFIKELINEKAHT